MRERRGVRAVAFLALVLGLVGWLGCKKGERVGAEEAPSASEAKLRSLGYTGGTAPQAASAHASPEQAVDAFALPAPAAPAAPAQGAVARKLIRKVELLLAVRDPQGAANAAQQLARRYQGYV
jgi:hypothetical protein